MTEADADATEGQTDAASSETESASELSRIVSGRLAPIAGQWHIDSGFTFLGFEVQRLFTRVHGRLERVSGTIVMAENPLESTIEVIIETGSIRTGHALTEAAIRSAQLLAVDDYPEARFVSTSLAAADSDRWHLFGDLTLRNVTKPIELLCRYKGAAQNPFGQQKKFSVEAETSFDRREFGIVDFQDRVPGAEGLMVVGNHVRLTLEIEANLDDSGDWSP